MSKKEKISVPCTEIYLILMVLLMVLLRFSFYFCENFIKDIFMNNKNF
jgi:hypothetical protein